MTTETISVNTISFAWLPTALIFGYKRVDQKSCIIIGRPNCALITGNFSSFDFSELSSSSSDVWCRKLVHVYDEGKD